MSTTVTGPPPVGRPPSRWAQVQARVRSAPRPTLWLNIGLAVLLVAAIVAAFLLIGNPGAPQQVERTAMVTRGTVTAGVTASGNAVSQVSTPASFEGSGTVTALNVKAGDTVTLGQVLATIDPASANAALRTAQAQLDGARAALAQAKAGPTSVKAEQDALALTQAQQNLGTAQQQLTQAKQQLDLDERSTDDAVDAAQKKLHDDQQKSTTCPAADTDSSLLVIPAADHGHGDPGDATTTPTPPPPAPGSPAPAARGGGTAAPAAPACTTSTTSPTTIDADRAAVTSAQNSRKDTLLGDQKSITTAQAQVTTDQNDITTAQLAQRADLHPETPDQIAGFQAAVDGDQVDVDTARLGAADTTLRAPQAGVVLAVNGRVGENSGGGSSSTTSSTSGTGTSSSASSAASSAGTGFVVIANASQLAVNATIAEADASKLAVGQPTRITFPATGTTATGSVVQITPQSTVTNNVVLYPIQVAIDSAPPGVGVGATATLAIQTASTDDVLKVPTAAITALGERHTVTLRRDGQDTVVPVQIGVQGDSDTEITSGVAEGDTLVLPSSTPAASNGIPGVTGGGAAGGGPRGGG